MCCDYSWLWNVHWKTNDLERREHKHGLVTQHNKVSNRNHASKCCFIHTQRLGWKGVWCTSDRELWIPEETFTRGLSYGWYGFNIQESAGLLCAEIKPLLLKRQKLTILISYLMSGSIGAVWQEFSLLESTLPVIYFIMCTPEEDNSVIDEVVTICCALCNCCDSVVPKE